MGTLVPSHAEASMGNHVSRLVLCATTAAGAGAVIATCSRCDCSESRTPPAPADPVLLRRDDEQLENSPRRAHLPPRTPSAVTRPVRLIQVQVVFRHGARLPSEDMDFSSPPVGSSRGSENHVWTKEDTKFDTRGLVPIKLLNSNAEVLSGGLSNGTIVQGSSGRLLLGGGRPGELSAVGWRESRALGERLRSRYLNPAGGPHSLSPAGGRGLPRGALFARTTAVKRAAQSAHAVLSGLERGLNLPSNLRAPLALRLNGEPQWMVYSRSGCPRLRQIFDQGMSDSVATAAAQQVMKKVKEKTGVEGRHAPTETYFGETTPIKELLQYQDHGTCRQLHGKALPPAVQDREGALWQQIDRTACFALCRAFVGGDLDNAAGLRQQALQLSMGRMLEHILQVMEWRGAPELCPWDTIDERAPDPVAATPRLFLYSGHDWTLIPLLMALQPSFGSSPGASPWPACASEIAFELYEEVVDDGIPRRFCCIRYCGEILSMPPACGAGADGLFRVDALRRWLADEGLLLETAQDYQDKCRSDEHERRSAL